MYHIAISLSQTALQVIQIFTKNYSEEIKKTKNKQNLSTLVHFQLLYAINPEKIRWKLTSQNILRNYFKTFNY